MAKYCANCGTELEDDAHFCMECGNEIRDDSKFYAQCGKTINFPNKQVRQEMKEKKKVSGIVVLIVVFLVVGFIIIGVLVQNKKKDSEASDTQTVTVEESEEIETIDDVVETSCMTTETQEEIKKEDTAQGLVLTNRDCAKIVSDMRTKTSSDTKKKETLLQFAQLVVFSKIRCDGGVILAEMPEGQKKLLNDAIADAVKCYDFFRGQFDFIDDWNYSLKEALPFFKEVYGCEEIKYTKEDVVQMADLRGGEPWFELKGGTVWENEKYYLLSGPYYYGYNGMENYLFEGYVDVLFLKNDESRFGVTMLYAKTDTIPKTIDSVETSSVLDMQANKDYDGSNLVDGKIETAWVEAAEGVGIGESVTLHLQEREEVRGLEIWNGYLASAELYDKNGKVNKIRIDFGNGIVREEEIPVMESIYVGEGIDEREFAYFFELDTPVITDIITITILDAEAGINYEDTCISEIKVY